VVRGGDLRKVLHREKRPEEHIFAIDIAETKTVNALKQAIKSEMRNAFRHVEADDLVLWNVTNSNIRLDTELGDFIRYMPLRVETALSPESKIAEIFPVALDDHLQLIVQHPLVSE
jgi:polyribonucleotide nucleotidyltransferase